MEYPTVFPARRYADANAIVDFLVEAFGAEKHAVHTADDGTLQHGELRFGNGIVMLGTSQPGETDPGGGIYVAVDDIDRHYERATAAGAEITRELQDTDYGSREYAARDPEGRSWYFGTYQPFAVSDP